ncbi:MULTISPECIES: GW domain-containing glycosaminoglycan-binding protein [unclassified Bacillus (in: firmicutes)]|uniref:GW domain-containing glycosaminoglycan-binding protein n=1 Tax=unclassified Bacillus (in: firmicutes) TaxID=185979 RepID=UPI0008EAA704|nr:MULTISPECIES: GW domain-containing glycosaminoglycan-binding protein [unclassified Bacillus (in: firmicutes)]SFJ95822.1 SH3-like domain-containing protein [Bacillus sp. 71mf]SFT01135.1 SH3-like domain-containing protein [Bacillus sp. 103mf]
MGKENKFTKSSKTVIAGALGVGVLLSTPSLLSAETYNQNEGNLQANVEVKGTESKENPPKTDIQKQEGQKDQVETANSKESNQIKQEEKEKQGVQKESKTKADNLKVVEEEKAKQDVTNEKTLSSQKTEATPMNKDNILINTDGENGIWTNPKDLEGSHYVGPANEYAGMVVHLSQKMVVENTTWYQFCVGGKEIGWVESKLFDNGLTEVQSRRFPNDAINDAIVGQDTNDGVWSLPYGVSGAKYIASSNVYSFDTIRITAQAKMNGQMWYAFSVDGKHIGWIHDKALSNKNIGNDHYYIIIGSSNSHGIWTKPYGLACSKYVAPTSQYAYEMVKLVKTVAYKGTQWGQIKNEKGIIGWIDLTKATASVVPCGIGSGVGSVRGNLPSSHGIWTLPYGDKNAKWVGSVSDYSFQPVKIVQKVSTGNVGWCKIQVGDRVLGWVDAQTLVDRSIFEEDKTVMAENVNDHAIWSIPYGLEGAKNVGNVSDYANSIMHVDKYTYVDNTRWYHVSVDGRDIGWLDSKAISGAFYILQRSGVYHVSTNDTSHGVWSRPYGMKNASWIGSAVEYKNKNLELKMSLRLRYTTWFAFDNGHGGVFWIDSDVVSEGKVN